MYIMGEIGLKEYTSKDLDFFKNLPVPVSRTLNSNISIIITFVNIQSLLNKVDVLDVTLNELQPDILCVNDHWCVNDHIETVHLNNYKLCSYYSRKTSIHGGSAIFVKKTVNFKPVNYVTNLSKQIIIECCAISITVNSINMCIICVYRPPNSCFSDFLNIFSQILVFCTTQFEKIIVFADLNIDFLNNIREKRILADIFNSYGLHITSYEYTRIFTNTLAITTRLKLDYKYDH